MAHLGCILYSTQWRLWAIGLTIALMSLLASCETSASPQSAASRATSTAASDTPFPQQTERVSTVPLTEPELWSHLQQATDKTIVVMLRHAIAPGTGDPANFTLGDCSTQRNLSEEGRQQARRIGAAFRDRNIPVTQVLSSQWCRCLETARLLDLGEVQPFPALNSFFGDRSRSTEQTAQIRQFLSENRNKPGVIVLVSHQVNITALSGVIPQSGEAVVMQVNGQVNFLGKLQP